MTLDFDAHLARESDAFLEGVLSADPDARVPGCPEWTADDLLSHLAGVQHFWAHVLRTRPEAPDGYEEPERPADRAGLEAYYRAATANLRAQLAAARDDDEEAWTWHDSIHTVGFIRRRQAHEALIHRVDAEQAAGQPSFLDPELAADGVLECIDWMYAGLPSWGSFSSTGERIALEPTDVAAGRVLVGLGRFTGTQPDSGVERDDDDVELLSASSSDPADVVVSGSAADLDLWLWHRGPLDTLAVSGYDAVFARLSAILGQPIS